MVQIESQQSAAYFEKVSGSLKPHPSKAKILIEINDENAFKTVLETLSKMGITGVEHLVPWKGFPEWKLFHVNTNNVKEAILELSEAGFTRVKGINPGKTKGCSQTEKGFREK